MSVTPGEGTGTMSGQVDGRSRSSTATSLGWTLRFIALTTALLQPPDVPGRPHTIIIDEPELGLHPYAITLLASMIRSVSQTTQIIVSTQSVNLLDALAEPEEVIVVERKDKESTFRRLDPEALKAWLEEYTLGELWEKNVLGGRP